MTIKEKARAYDEAIKVAKEWHTDAQIGFKANLETLFPELKESKDERIRKAIICGMAALKDQGKETFATIPINDCIAWLEKQGDKDKLIKELGEYKVKYTQEVLSQQLRKQGEQKSTDKIEPKFNLGNWIVQKDLGIYKVVEVCESWYEVISYNDGIQYSIGFDKENDCHLWTIKDAKDGDVLSYVTDEEDLWIMIYWSLYEPYEGHVHYHALLVNDNFSDKGTCCICINDLKPATKEQRDLLFAKMKEAGYEWNEEKKELKKFHIIDEGKAEMDYCFTKMMNGEKVSSAWSEEDEKFIKRIHSLLYAINENDFEDIHAWLKSLKERI